MRQKCYYKVRAFQVKKDEKRKNRTKMDLLLISMIKLDHFSIVVFGFWSERF